MIQIEKLESMKKNEIFPVTIAKFLINKKNILNFMNNDVDNIDDEEGAAKCSLCTTEKLCRKHNSLQRIIESKPISKLVGTNLYFYMNEIFTYNPDTQILKVIYCPHFKLIVGNPINTNKIKKISYFSFKVSLNLSDKNIKLFSLESNAYSCWFMDNLTLLILKVNKDLYKWFLTTQKVD